MPYRGLGQIRSRLPIHYLGIFRPCQELFWGIRPRNFEKIQTLGVDKRQNHVKLRGGRGYDAGLVHSRHCLYLIGTTGTVYLLERGKDQRGLVDIPVQA